MKKFRYGLFGLEPVLCLLLLYVYNVRSQLADVEMEPVCWTTLCIVLMGTVLAAGVHVCHILSGRFQVTVSAIWIIVIPALFWGVMSGKLILPEFLEPLIYGTGKLGMLVDVLIGGYLLTLITGVLKIKRTA